MDGSRIFYNKRILSAAKKILDEPEVVKIQGASKDKMTLDGHNSSSSGITGSGCRSILSYPRLFTIR